MATLTTGGLIIPGHSATPTHYIVHRTTAQGHYVKVYHRAGHEICLPIEPGQKWAFNKDTDDHAFEIVHVEQPLPGTHGYLKLRFRTTLAAVAPMEVASQEEFLGNYRFVGFATLERPETDLSRYPHTCKTCGSRSFNSFSSVDCSNAECSTHRGMRR